jgi:hypothetical protein|tara:strand:- start:1144 stop:1422 length:279 start_codon:yes stop_codon:yes gene_type:complete
MKHDINGMESILEWIKSSPFESSVSSVSGGYVHIKIKVPDKKVDLSSLDENKIFDPKLQKKTTLGEYLGQTEVRYLTDDEVWDKRVANHTED